MKEVTLEAWRGELMRLYDLYGNPTKLAVDLSISTSALYNLKAKVSDETFNPNIATKDNINKLAKKKGVY